MRNNIILNTDSYKLSHMYQNPPGTEYKSSYIESRGGKWDYTLFFGLQMFLKAYPLKVTQEDIEEAQPIIESHGFAFNREDWQTIVDEFDGWLPLKIEAVPEGTIVPTRNVLVQMTNTDPRFPWLPAYVETALLRAIWYPTTIATLSHSVKQTLKKYFTLTSDDTEMQGLMFKLHDFGARGVSSFESAGIGGLAHLINFAGTDTVTSLVYAKEYYNAKEMPAFSIPASEHSTITIWGGPEEEYKAHRNMVRQFGKPDALLASVSDSYDIFYAAGTIWPSLRQEIIDSGATVVIRPDSGDPSETPVKVMEILMEKFGYTTNSKGYKVLPDYIRVIQGDGNTPEIIEKTLALMADRSLSVDNIAFGMGGGLLQDVDRDTLQFAMKTSSAVIDGETRDIYKDPVGSKSKASKRGRLALRYKYGEGFSTVRKENLGSDKNALRLAYINGVNYLNEDLDSIRKRSNLYSN